MNSYQSNPWVVKPKPNPNARIKIFCLPFAGGSSVSYRNWIKYLPEDIELCPVEIPGRGIRMNETLISDLSVLVKKIAEGIYPELDKPFILFGHSMGTALGFELAHLLAEKYKKQAEYIFLSGRGAPHLPDREEPIHLLPEQQFVSKLKEYNGTPKEVLEHEELMQLMLPIIRADFQVCETYSNYRKEPLDIPITALGGLEDSSTLKEDLEAWKSYTTKKFNIRMFPGGHFYLNDQQPALLENILRDINSELKLG